MMIQYTAVAAVVNTPKGGYETEAMINRDLSREISDFLDVCLSSLVCEFFVANQQIRMSTAFE